MIGDGATDDGSGWFQGRAVRRQSLMVAAARRLLKDVYHVLKEARSWRAAS